MILQFPCNIQTGTKIVMVGWEGARRVTFTYAHSVECFRGYRNPLIRMIASCFRVMSFSPCRFHGRWTFGCSLICVHVGRHCLLVTSLPSFQSPRLPFLVTISCTFRFAKDLQFFAFSVCKQALKNARRCFRETANQQGIWRKPPKISASEHDSTYFVCAQPTPITCRSHKKKRQLLQECPDQSQD